MFMSGHLVHGKDPGILEDYGTDTGSRTTPGSIQEHQEDSPADFANNACAGDEKD
jgi:hypothetical protein